MIKQRGVERDEARNMDVFMRGGRTFFMEEESEEDYRYDV